MENFYTVSVQEANDTNGINDKFEISRDEYLEEYNYKSESEAIERYNELVKEYKSENSDDVYYITIWNIDPYGDNIRTTFVSLGQEVENCQDWYNKKHDL